VAAAPDSPVIVRSFAGKAERTWIGARADQDGVVVAGGIEGGLQSHVIGDDDGGGVGGVDRGEKCQDRNEMGG